MNSTHTLAGGVADRYFACKDASTPRPQCWRTDLALVFSDAMEQGSIRILFKMVRIGRLG